MVRVVTTPTMVPARFEGFPALTAAAAGNDHLRVRSHLRLVALLAILVACSSAPQTSPGPSNGPALDPADAATLAEPSRAQLINAAVEAGQIDEITGLIYRAQSALGVPGVPDEYLAGVPRPDDGVFAAMANFALDASEADQARLRPYLVRPTEPDSVFHPATTASRGVVSDTPIGIAQQPAQHPTATCSNWSNSGDLDSRFKVWACADSDAQDAEIDIATVVAMVAGIWDPMTASTPNGMGPPKPDGYGSNISADAGGDARIDFYLLELGQVIRRADQNQGIEDAEATAAAAVAAAPYWDQNGTGQRNSSGFVLLNRARLGDEVNMRQDVIHEFFHVLQYAHNLKGTHRGTAAHWFVEASAVWAETWYDRSNSDRPHSWFGLFQARPVGLEDPDEDHQYSAYAWPFFMQEEKDSTAVFAAWQAIDAVTTGDFKGVTDKINDQLSFRDNFGDFAVRNWNYPDFLRAAGEEAHADFDGNFLSNWPPAHEQSGSVAPDEPYEPAVNTQPLAASYFHINVAESAKEVIVSVQGVNPAGQRDQDVLVHIKGGSWERRQMTNGQLKFCRDDPGDDIDIVELIVSNTGREGNLSGNARATAKPNCNRELHFGGTIQYDEYSRIFIPGSETSPDWERTVTLNGTLQVVLLVRGEYSFEMTAERDGGSTYAYDYERKQSDGFDECTTHEQGTLETFGGVSDEFFGDWSIGMFNVIGGPGDDEINLSISIWDWCGEQMGRNVPEDERNHNFKGFTTCPESGWLTGEFDGTANFIIDCSYEYDRSYGDSIDVGNGHISGTLSPLDGPFPTPRTN